MIRSLRYVPLVLLASFASALLSLGAESQETVVSALPAAQTSDDYRMTISDLEWNDREDPNGYPRAAMGLQIHYDLTRVDGAPLPPNTDIGKYTTLQVYSDGVRSNPSSRSWSNGFDWRDGIDPRGKTLQIHLDVVDPTGAAAKIGVYDDTVKMNSLPIPSTVGEAIHPARQFMTPLGTVISVDSVSIEAPSDRYPKGRMKVLIKNTPAAEVRDDKIVYWSMTAFTDNAGFDYLKDAHEGSGPIPHGYVYYLDRQLNPGAGSFSISFRISESAPSLIAPALLHQFRFSIPMALIPVVRSRIHGVRGNIVSTGNMEAYVERGPSENPTSDSMVLWSRDTSRPRDKSITSQCQLQINYQDGSAQDSYGWSQPLLWHSDGTPPGQGESAFVFHLNTKSSKTNSPAQSATFTLRGKTDTVETLVFPNITPPPIGVRRFLSIPPTKPSAFGVTLRSVEIFDERHKLSHPLVQSNLPSEGIAFILARPRDTSDPQTREEQTALSLEDLNNAGTANSWDRTGLPYGLTSPDEVSPWLGGKLETLFIEPMPSNLDSPMTLRIRATQKITDPTTQTLTVPIPPIPILPTASQTAAAAKAAL